jgi:hypothetical protein
MEATTQARLIQSASADIMGDTEINESTELTEALIRVTAQEIGAELSTTEVRMILDDVPRVAERRGQPVLETLRDILASP